MDLKHFEENMNSTKGAPGVTGWLYIYESS